MSDTAFQTLDQFITKPFGNNNMTEYNKFTNDYSRMKSDIIFSSYSEDEGDYMFHIIIPSESNKGQVYDVVVLLFTDETNSNVKRRFSIRDYYVKFFSNSPSFIYQYAAMYHLEGFLIDALFEKMDKDYADIIPKNPKDLSYDKSIFCACKYLLDNHLVLLNKMGLRTKKKKSSVELIKDIQTFKDVKISSEINKVANQINKEVDKNQGELKKLDLKSKSSQTSKIKRVIKKTKTKSTLSKPIKKSISKAKRIRATKHVK